MHTAEETASLLASLAPFSLFPTSKDDDARWVTLSASKDGQYCLQQGMEEREIGQIQCGCHGLQY